MKNLRRSRFTVSVRFILFYSELAPTNPRCIMLQALTWTEKYEEELSDKQPLNQNKTI